MVAWDERIWRVGINFSTVILREQREPKDLPPTLPNSQRSHAQQRDPSSLRSVGMTGLGRSVGMTDLGYSVGMTVFIAQHPTVISNACERSTTSPLSLSAKPCRPIAINQGPFMN